MSIINSMIKRKGTVERSRREKESKGEFSLYNTMYFRNIENSNISVKGYNWSAIDLLLPYEKYAHIPKKLGEDLERLMYSTDVIGIHRKDASIDFTQPESELVDNVFLMDDINIGILATGQVSYGAVEDIPLPSNTFDVFTGLSGWLNFVGSYKNNDVIYLYRFPKGTVSEDLSLLDTENKSGLYTEEDGLLYFSKDNIIGVITKDPNGKFKMYDPEVLRKQYEERNKQL